MTIQGERHGVHNTRGMEFVYHDFPYDFITSIRFQGCTLSWETQHPQVSTTV